VRAPARFDALILDAWRLLARLEPYECPPLADVWIEPLDVEISGYCTHGGEIIINPRAWQYRRRDVYALALLVHHEHFHALHGPDEPRAYAASAAFATRHAPYLLTAVYKSWQATMDNRALADLRDTLLEIIEHDEWAW
jgi:hypothetical protein